MGLARPAGTEFAGPGLAGPAGTGFAGPGLGAPVSQLGAPVSQAGAPAGPGRSGGAVPVGWGEDLAHGRTHGANRPGKGQ